MDAADDGGTVAGLGAAARPVGELSDHSGEADEQADDQAPESPLQCKMLSTQTTLSVRSYPRHSPYDSWEGFQLTPLTRSSGTSDYRKWMDE